MSDTNDPFAQPYNMDLCDVTEQEAQHYLSLLPPGTGWDTSKWFVASILALPLAIVGHIAEYIFTSAAWPYYMQGLLALAWRRTRIGFYTWQVHHELKVAQRADLIRALSGDIDPRSHEQVKAMKRERVRKAVVQLALYLRETDPGFLGPRWQGDPRFWEVPFEG